MVSFFSLFVSCNKTTTIPDVVGKWFVIVPHGVQGVVGGLFLHDTLIHFFFVRDLRPCIFDLLFPLLAVVDLIVIRYVACITRIIFPAALAYTSSHSPLSLLTLSAAAYGLCIDTTDSISCGRPRCPQPSRQLTSITSGVWQESTTSALGPATTESTRTSLVRRMIYLYFLS